MIEFLKQQFLHNQLFTGLVSASIIGGIIVYFKNIPMQIWNSIKQRIIYSVTIYQNDPLYDDFEAWFYSTHDNKYRNIEAGVKKTKSDYNSPITEHNINLPVIYYKQIEGFFVVKYKGRILFVKKGRDKLEHASDIRAIYFDQYHISTLFGLSAIKKLLHECIEFNNTKRIENSIKIYTHNTYGEWYSYGIINSKKIDNIIINPILKAKLLNDVQTFICQKDWYERASIFYKRGYLFYGEPGNGKTSLAVALANHTKRDLYILDLNSITENHMLKTAFSNIGRNSILLIEDIDGFYNLRESVKKDSKLSFSTFLNCLDGVFFKEGLITIITTNKIEMVDSALKRAGRMDFVEEIEKPTYFEVKEYLSRFYMTEIKSFYYDSHLSMCDIQAICSQHPNDLNKAISELSSIKNQLNGKVVSLA